uniref:Uncharacterized protein n=1 Tax=Cyanothece sp. (strain PCC 7425 / ATCC 29141) TaxID=395961 RepID=B8HN18_CYAP4
MKNLCGAGAITKVNTQHLPSPYEKIIPELLNASFSVPAFYSVGHITHMQIEVLYWKLSLHWVVKKWDSDHRIPVKAKLFGKLEPKGKFLVTLLEAVENLFILNKDCSDLYQNAGELFSYILIEMMIMIPACKSLSYQQQGITKQHLRNQERWFLRQLIRPDRYRFLINDLSCPNLSAFLNCSMNVFKVDLNYKAVWYSLIDSWKALIESFHRPGWSLTVLASDCKAFYRRSGKDYRLLVPPEFTRQWVTYESDALPFHESIISTTRWGYHVGLRWLDRQWHQTS